MVLATEGLTPGHTNPTHFTDISRTLVDGNSVTLNSLGRSCWSTTEVAFLFSVAPWSHGMLRSVPTAKNRI